MNTFNRIFQQWAPIYDTTVFSNDHEYGEIFANYDVILATISNYFKDMVPGIIVDIGMGTGNLAQRLAADGQHVIGVDPSPEMRQEAAKKLRQVTILDGHFMSIPVYNRIDGFVTSYAFHHLTYREKVAAIGYLDSRLTTSGRIVLADTMFRSVSDKQRIYDEAKRSGSMNLLHDLQTEYYELLDDVTRIFADLGYSYDAVQMNKFVWIISAKKGGTSNG